LSDAQLANAIDKETQSPGFLEEFSQTIPGKIGKAGLDLVGEFGAYVDRFTGSPTRAAIGAAQEGRGLEGAVEAFAGQFGGEPSQAPTGKDIALKTGFSERENIPLPFFGSVSPAGIAGLVVDIAADPTNVVPGAAIMKGATKATVKGVKTAAPVALKGSAAAADFATGTEIGTKTVNVLTGAVEDTSEILSKLFMPRVAPDAKKFQEIAKKHGMDIDNLPEAVEFGDNSVITRAARKRNEGILGEKFLDQHAKATQDVNKALDKVTDKVSGGAAGTPADAGQAIRDGLDEAADRVFKEASTTYNSVWKGKSPDFTVPDEALGDLDKVLNRVETRAKETIGAAFTGDRRLPSKQVVDLVEKLRQTNGNYQAMVHQLQEIGEVAFKNKHTLGRVEPDIKTLREIYHATSEALIKGAGDLGPDLKRSNEILTQFFSDKSVIGKTANNTKIAPEVLFNNLVKNGNTNTIKSLKAVLSPEKFNALKGAMLKSLGKKNIDDLISFKGMNNAMEAKPDLMRSLFNPTELIEVKELLELGNRLGSPVLSTSGTGASNVFEFARDVVGKAVTGRASIDILKARARKANLSAEQTKGLIEAAKKDGTSGLSKAIDRLKRVNFKRTKNEKRVKASQVLSVQQQEENN
jgi:hypothetical protein